MNLFSLPPSLSICCPPVGSDFRYHQFSEATSCDCRGTVHKDVSSDLPRVKAQESKSYS